MSEQTVLDAIAALALKVDAIKLKTDTLGGDLGAVTWTYTLRTAGSVPIADADVWGTSDSDGLTVLASGRTNNSGVVTLFLDPGTVYVWAQKAGWSFTNPDTEVVS